MRVVVEVVRQSASLSGVAFLESARTKTSLVDFGRGLVIMGQNGVSLSSRIAQMVLESMAGW